MSWQKDPRLPSGGHWRCKVGDRERHRERYGTDPAYREAKLAKQRDTYFHQGWKLKRLRDLNRERAQVLRALEELEAS